MGVKEFAIPMALLLIAVLVYLLIIGRLTGWPFALSLFAVVAFSIGVAVIIPRSEEVTEIGGKVSSEGAQLLVKMQTIQSDVYAKAEALRKLAEQVGEVAAFNLAHLGRWSPDNLDELLLKERDRLIEMLHRAGIDDKRIKEITFEITKMVTFDLARDVWSAVPKEIFNTWAAAGFKDTELGV